MGSGCGHMSTAQYAVHRKCSDSYVRRLKRTGKLALCEHGEIDAAASDRLLADILNPVRGGDRSAGAAATPAPPAAPSVPSGAGESPRIDGISVHEAVRRERLAKARISELELGELSGQLIRRQDAQRATVTLVRQAVSRMRLMASRLRGQLAATSDPRKCEALIDADIDAICADMQKDAALVASGEANTDQQAAA
jgi:hypothetical protein